MKFISSQTKVSADLNRRAEQLAEQGKTPLLFTRNGKLLGIIAVADVIKEDSPRAVKELQNMGIRVVMLTGDNERTAKAIGAQAGVDDVIAGVLPDGKESVIRALKEQERLPWSVTVSTTRRHLQEPISELPSVQEQILPLMRQISF